MIEAEKMRRRQRVLADFGEFALHSDDLDAVLTQACRLVAEALDTSRAKVLEIQEAEESASLFVRAGIGLGPGIVGRLRLQLSEQSSEAYSIRAGVPVITKDVALEDRFDVQAFLTGAGVRAICNVPIFLPGGRAFGLLQVDADEPRPFDDDDSQFLRTYATILGPVIDRLLDLGRRREAEKRLRENEERLRLALEAGRLAAWDTDLRTGKVEWSKEYYSMLGYSAGEVEPSVGAWIARMHPDDRAATVAARDEARRERQDYAREFRIVRPDGETRWCSARGRFFYDEAGEAVRMIGVMDDITERRSFEETQAVLIAELQHRTKNLVAVVNAITTRTIAGSASLEDFKTRFVGRLAALARAQNLLSESSAGRRVTFDELVRAQLAGVGALDAKAYPGQVSLEGPEGIGLQSGHVQTFALGLHELATNALKYGALSRPEGCLAVRWRVEETADHARELVVEWRETGMRLDVPELGDARRGYGRELIERALAYQLRARTEFELRAEGVQCLIALPLEDDVPSA